MSEVEDLHGLRHPANGQFNWQRSLRWFLAEFLVVVAGILVALWVNGWWIDRLERAQERDLLLGLQSEFSENLDLFDRTANQHRETIAQARRLLELTGPSPAAIEPKEIDKLLFPLVSDMPSFHPAMGEVEAMLGAGHLDLVQNRELRAALAGWPGVLALLRETEDEMRSDVLHGFYPYLVTQVPLVTLDHRMGIIDTQSPSRFPMDYSALLSDFVFENHVENRWVMANFILEDGAPVRDRIVEILRLIDRELAGQ